LASAIPASQGFGWHKGIYFLRGVVEEIGERRKRAENILLIFCGV
jgi:hypothetical protein